jgi:uncharacterized protein YjbI with pentapeptide repeats
VSVTDAVDRTARAVDAAAAHVQRIHLGFLLFCAYLGVTLASVTHEDLLRDTSLRLPVLAVQLSAVAFYSAIPVLLLILHIHLMLQLHLLSRKIFLQSDTLRDDHTAEQTAVWMRYQYPLAHVLGSRAYGRPIRWLAYGYVWLTLLLAPAVLLLWCQISFLPYHSWFMTWLQRITLCCDLAIAWVLWPTVTSRSGKWRLWEGDGKSVGRSILVGVGILFTCMAAFIAFVLAVNPGEPLEKISLILGLTTPMDETPITPRKYTADWMFYRHLHLPHRTLVREQATSALALTCDRRTAADDRAWRRSIEGLDLQRRDFRGANFFESTLINADLRRTHLNRAWITNGRLQGSDLRWADLIDAKMEWARFDDAVLEGAHLNRTTLERAILRRAMLAETVLRSATLANVDLRGAILDNADLRAVDLKGANLEGARLHGAHLEGAVLQGARMEYADLRNAHLDGADVRGASVWETSLAGASVALADFRGINQSLPPPERTRELTDLLLNQDSEQLPWWRTEPADRLRSNMQISNPEPLITAGVAGSGAVCDGGGGFPGCIEITKDDEGDKQLDTYGKRLGRQLAVLARDDDVVFGVARRIGEESEVDLATLLARALLADPDRGILGRLNVGQRGKMHTLAERRHPRDP